MFVFCFTDYGLFQTDGLEDVLKVDLIDDIKITLGIFLWTYRFYNS